MHPIRYRLAGSIGQYALIAQNARNVLRLVGGRLLGSGKWGHREKQAQCRQYGENAVFHGLTLRD